MLYSCEEIWFIQRGRGPLLTADVNTVEQLVNTYKVQNNAAYWDRRQHANFRGNPLCQATKRHFV